MLLGNVFLLTYPGTHYILGNKTVRLHNTNVWIRIGPVSKPSLLEFSNRS